MVGYVVLKVLSVPPFASLDSSRSARKKYAIAGVPFWSGLDWPARMAGLDQTRRGPGQPPTFFGLRTSYSYVVDKVFREAFVVRPAIVVVADRGPAQSRPLSLPPQIKPRGGDLPYSF